MAKPQLTLVKNTGNWQSRAVSETHKASVRHTAEHLPNAEQLDLFEEPTLPDIRVFVVAMDTVHGRKLQTAILSYRPRSVIDLRYAARFDQYGSDRETLFAYFQSVGSYYALDSMPWHDLSARDFMTEGGVHVPRAHYELIELNKGTIMFMVPKPQHANMLVMYLNRMLLVKAKKSWRIEQIT